MGLIACVLLVIAVFAWLTFPDVHVYRGQDALGEWETARRGWFVDIKDLLQLLVVSILVPLLTTVIGYIFGREASAGD